MGVGLKGRVRSGAAMPGCCLIEAKSGYERNVLLIGKETGCSRSVLCGAE